MQAEVVKALVIKGLDGKVQHVVFGSEAAQILLLVREEYAEGDSSKLAEIQEARKLLTALPRLSSVDTFVNYATSVAGGMKDAGKKYASIGENGVPPETGFALCFFAPGPGGLKEFYFSFEALKEGLENPAVDMPEGHKGVILGIVQSTVYPFPKKRTWLDKAYDQLKRAWAKAKR